MPRRAIEALSRAKTTSEWGGHPEGHSVEQGGPDDHGRFSAQEQEGAENGPKREAERGGKDRPEPVVQHPGEEHPSEAGEPHEREHVAGKQRVDALVEGEGHHVCGDQEVLEPADDIDDEEELKAPRREGLAQGFRPAFGLHV